MKNSIKIIKFTSICTILFGIITYLISINMDAGILVINSKLISNNFILTIAGGTFASFLVVLLSEWKKYFDTKNDVKTSMFYQTLYLYEQLFYMNRLICEFLDQPQTIIPEKSLANYTNKANCQINAIRYCMYEPFLQNNILKINHNKFCKNVIPKIDYILTHSSCLDMAIITEKINNLDLTHQTGGITSGATLVNKVLLILQNDTKILLDDINEYLTDIDEYCKKRYNWTEIKNTLTSNYKNILSYDTFEEFIKQNEPKINSK